MSDKLHFVATNLKFVEHARKVKHHGHAVKDSSSADLEILSFSVDDKSVGLRLDAYLASQINQWSRSRLQRLIEGEDVLVNGRPSRASYKLRRDDQIEVELSAPATASFAPESIPIDIVYEDETIIVVNKPAGLVVHPAAGVQSGTLANALAYHFRQLPAGGGMWRPGIVHRLDRDTSGLLVVAKTDSAHEHLSNQFRDRAVFKSYVALVHGRIDTDAGQVNQPIGRDPFHRTRMAVVRGGRNALTLFRVRRRFQRFTLLDVELKTGRTHQIRVHLAWLKHPVVGDEVYGAGRDKTIQNARLKAKIRNLSRHFLHAEKLAFTHPVTGKLTQFSAPLPPELSDLLTELETEDR